MTPAALLDRMAPAARKRFGSDKRWAQACGLSAETLSRLRSRASCDLQTVNALAAAAGFELALAPASAASMSADISSNFSSNSGGSFSDDFSRAREDELLDLCASGTTEPAHWRAHGGGSGSFFIGGLAMLLASARGFDRRRYIELAETLHPGISQPEVFELWLRRSPLRPARFLPLLRHRRAHAA